jgi:hypothetical protein
MTAPQPATLDREKDKLPYPPPWQDIGTLARHVSICPNTVDNWVTQGILPPPRKRGGKLMWKWEEVDAWLSKGGQDGPPSTATEVRNAVKREREADRHARV